MHNLSDVSNVTIDIVKQAGELVKDYFHKKNFTHHSKGGVDFATQADDELDAFLRQSLKKKYPETTFLTEETAPNDFAEFSGKENLWIIDPIDGTTNFARGDAHFSISVGLYSEGKMLLGIVYLPVESGGKLYTARHDEKNAYCNDKPLSVSMTNDLLQASVAVDWSWSMEKRKKNYALLGRLLTMIRQPRSLGSASADLCLVAEGILDGYCTFGLKPWDVAAGSLILEKAGGKLTKDDGSRWHVFESDLVSSNGVLHDKLLRAVNRSE